MFTPGVSYYPEDWTADRIREDAEDMKNIGMKLVRIGEFAWSHMEPADGQFDFGWLHQAMDIFREKGLEVILCTPTASAPPWLVHEHPDVLKVMADGSRAYIGVRQHSCYSSRTNLRYCARIVEKLAEEFRDQPNLYAWQIDNEVGQSIFQNCCCPDCQRAFREFLRGKYATVAALNQAWGNTFWSLEYSDWEQVCLGGPDLRLNPSQVLDSQLFRSQAMTDYVVMQADIIRRHMPRTIITTNNPSPLLDRRRLYRKLDAAAADVYINQRCSLSDMASRSDAYRCFKPGVPAWLLEVAPAPWRPEKNLMQFLAWQFFARGQDTQVYFHWRSHPAGKEKINPTFISFSGRRTDSWHIFRETCRQIHQAMDRFGTLPQPVCQAAVLTDFQSDWIFVQGESPRFSWMDNGHRALTELGINADIISPEDDFSSYRLLVIPVLPCIAPEIAGRLRSFVQSGGVVLLGSQAGIYDQYAKYIQGPGPENLTGLFGLEIEDGVTFIQGLESMHPGVSGELDGAVLTGEVSHWIGRLNILDADILMRYQNGMYEGLPFLTEHRFGEGHALYHAGAGLDHETYRAIVRHAARLAGLPLPELPEGVEIISRGPVVFIFNYSRREARFSLPLKGRNLLTEAPVGETFTLAPLDFIVLAQQI